MPLIDATELRTLFDIATGISADRLTLSIRNASRTVAGWVGAAAYADAEDDSPEDEDRASALKDAESYVAMYHALLNAGARLRNNGLVSREQDAGGPMGGVVVNQYYTPKEIADLRAEYLAQAESIAAPFIEAEEQSALTGAGTMTLKGGWTGDD